MIGLSRATSGRSVKPGVLLAEAPLPTSGGRWALSRILQPTPGVFQTAAQSQTLAPSIHVHYPPLNPSKTGYVSAWALVRLLGTVGTPNVDTALFPALALTDPLGANLASVQSLISTRLTALRYVDRFRATVGKSALPTAGYTAATVFGDVLRDVLRYVEHSTTRIPRFDDPESHNTEYLDPFSTDPSGRWTARIQTASWDDPNDEYDVSHVGSVTLLEYTANTPGSIEHEVQVTTISSASEPRVVAVACRIDGATSDAYFFDGRQNDNLTHFSKRVGGAFTSLQTDASTFNDGDFVHFRLAAAGGAGANVALSGWIQHTGSTAKPSDPGWLGVDGSPNFTYTDTSADRLDDSVHDACGIGGGPAVNTDYDTRHCFWKSRAISDRGGGGGADTNARLLGGDLLHSQLFGRLVA